MAESRPLAGKAECCANDSDLRVVRGVSTSNEGNQRESTVSSRK
jgi:hypothetical protein